MCNKEEPNKQEQKSGKACANSAMVHCTRPRDEIQLENALQFSPLRHDGKGGQKAKRQKLVTFSISVFLGEDFLIWCGVMV